MQSTSKVAYVTCYEETIPGQTRVCTILPVNKSIASKESTGD